MFGRKQAASQGLNCMTATLRFGDLERGPALVGSPERVAEKILDYHASYRHDLQSVSINHVLEPAHQDDVLRRFAEEVVPLVKAEVKTDLWGPADARRPAGFTAV